LAGQSDPGINEYCPAVPDTDTAIEHVIAKEMLTVDYPDRISLRKNSHFFFLGSPNIPREA
jgi:hypothetical protein